MRSLVLIGGGGHARVVLDAARTSGDPWQVVGFIDPRPCPELQALGVPWLGDDATADPGPDAHLVVAVGALAARRALVAASRNRAARWATVIHPRAVVSERADIGDGVVILAGAIVNAEARVGDHCIINTGAIVEHDVRLGAFAHVGPGAVIGGGAEIGPGASIALGARVRDHVEVGAEAVVGMGAVVVGPVAEGLVVVGIPARPKEGT